MIITSLFSFKLDTAVIAADIKNIIDAVFGFIGDNNRRIWLIDLVR